MQDTWQATPALTLAAGLRFDRTTLLLAASQWSPRLGAGVRRVAAHRRCAPRSAASTSRRSPNTCCSPRRPRRARCRRSSTRTATRTTEEGGASAGGADVEPERQWALEAGVEHRFGRGAAPRRRLLAASRRRVRRSQRVLRDDDRVPERRRRGAGPRRRRAARVRARRDVVRLRQRQRRQGDAGGADHRRCVPRGRRRRHRAGRRVHARPRSAGRRLGRTDVDRVARRALSMVGRLRERDAARAGRGRGGRPGVAARSPIASTSSAGRVQVRARRCRCSRPCSSGRDRASAISLRGAVLNLFDARYAYNFGNPFSGTHFGAPAFRVRHGPRGDALTRGCPLGAPTRASGVQLDITATGTRNIPSPRQQTWRYPFRLMARIRSVVVAALAVALGYRRDAAGPTQGASRAAATPARQGQLADRRRRPATHLVAAQRDAHQPGQRQGHEAGVEAASSTTQPRQLHNLFPPLIVSDVRDDDRAEADRRRRRRLRQPLRHRPRRPARSSGSGTSTARSPSRPAAAATTRCARAA